MASKTTYAVDFERIGRRHDLSAPFEVVDADDLAEQIYRFSRRYLRSSWYGVGLDLEAGTGSIEAGRFGRFSFRGSGGRLMAALDIPITVAQAKEPDTCVYLFWHDDEVLYVGRTARLSERAAEHRANKPWWDQVKNIEVIRLQSLYAAERAEVSLIRLYRPRWNVQHNGGDIVPVERRQEALCLDCGDVVAACDLEEHRSRSCFARMVSSSLMAMASMFYDEDDA